MPPGELVDDEPAGVVPVRGVLAARVAEPDDEQVERGALPARPQPHGDPSSRRSPGRRTRPRPTRTSPRRRLPPRPRAPSPSSPSSPSTGSGSTSRVGAVTVATTVSGSSSSVTFPATTRSATRSVPPISIVETSRSRCSGISSGSASTFSSRSGCESTPPSRTPGASSPPMSCTVTEAVIARSSRTSWRSMCVIPPRTGSTWYSLRIDACDEPLPSTSTSRIECRPPAPVSARRSSRDSTAIAIGSPPP